MLYKVAKSIWDIKKNIKENLRKKKVEKKLGLDNKNRFYYPTNTLSGNYKFTVISAVYGVEKYIDEMLSSLLRQTLDFKSNIQVILVNDGSIDRSADICEEWAAQFPNNIKVIHKENGGQASARNAGLPYANGDWVTFIDPDDLVDKDYFLNVDKELSKSKNIALASCPYIMYEEAKCKLINRHPLRYRFNYGVREVVFDEKCTEMHFHASSTFFNRNVLKEKGIVFSDIRPNGEDFHFIAKLLLSLENPTLLYIPSAKYWYRKRADQSSTLDTAWKNPLRYSEQIEKCYLDLVKKSLRKFNSIPLWLQRAITYDLCFHIKHFTNNAQNKKDISHGLRKNYLKLLKKAFSYIDPELITQFELANLSDDHRFIMLSLGHPELSTCSRIKFFSWDQKNNLLGIRYHYVGKKPEVVLKVSNQPIQPKYEKIRTHSFLDEVTAYSVDGWFPWHGNGMIDIEVNGCNIELPLSHRAKNRLIENLQPKVKSPNKFPLPVKIYRSVSQNTYYKKKFKDAWLIMDRDTHADDNGEHFYRWLKKNHPEINAWFILRNSSPDWVRLKKEGFKLLSFGSFEHKMALLNSKELISSQADHYVLELLKRNYYQDLMQYDFTFLQHGVIMHDLSGWLNRKNIKNFITSSSDERASITSNYSAYKFTDKEVKLVGLPRHDYLYANKRNAPKKKVVVMPTWRQSLVGLSSGMTNKREVRTDFIESNFYHAWKGFLNSERLKNLLSEYGYEMIFFPHANLEPYKKHFKTKGIELVSHLDGITMQKLFLDSSVLITDYSSVAFEMAYIKRPVLYYQFDEEEVFNGAHTTQRGYFDYRRDGFGPVCTDREELLVALEEIFKNNCAPQAPYEERMNGFFEFRDGKCSERVFNAIVRH